MKKILMILLAMSLFLVACSSNEQSKDQASDDMTITVASHTDPMTTILDLIKDDLELEGYTLEVMQVSDNVQANVALQNKEADANFFQHEPFMMQFNEGNGANLVKATPVYNALVSFYSKDYTSLDQVEDGAIVAIPNDSTNRTRALRLLATSNLITLDNPESYDLGVENIVDNPKNLEFKEWGLLNLNEAYQESNLTFNYPTYIQALDLKPEEDGLLLEPQADQTYAITVAARQDNIDSKKIESLVKHITSDEVKTFINEKLDGHAKPAF